MIEAQTGSMAEAKDFDVSLHHCAQMTQTLTRFVAQPALRGISLIRRTCRRFILCALIAPYSSSLWLNRLS